MLHHAIYDALGSNPKAWCLVSKHSTSWPASPAHTQTSQLSFLGCYGQWKVLPSWERGYYENWHPARKAWPGPVTEQPSQWKLKPTGKQPYGQAGVTCSLCFLFPAPCFTPAFGILGPIARPACGHSSHLPRAFAHKKDGLVGKEQYFVHHHLEGPNGD